jgi:4-amino-4-deoxy-L-arabinose transferase-like glycosyltransferase
MSFVSYLRRELRSQAVRPPVVRPRWAVWRSPAGQPGWARPALLGIAALAALLYAWNITKAGYAPLYSQAVQYMSQSWKGFLYGALNRGATLDKLAGSFMPQALSARIFGYHAWSLALPQVIEGVISVLVMYRVVRRWAGVVPGLLAAGIFTLTPIAASMFGHSMEDGALTMCLVLAADAWQRAVLEGRLRSLIWSGVWVGLGFQAKMLQAWMVLPALGIGYLVAAPGPVRRRLWQLAAAGAVMLVVSMSLAALYTLTPAKDRPYINGSTDNSAIAMVFGWNGLGRFGIHIPGAPTSGGVQIGRNGIHIGNPGLKLRAPGGPADPGAAGPSSGKQPAPGARVRLGPGGSGRTKLLGGRFGAEIGWLYPLALLALAAGLWQRRREPRTGPLRSGYLMWGLWLLTFGVIFSAMSVIPHTAYVASLAPPLAALSGAGIVLLWRAYRAGGRGAWLLPAAVVAELAWAGWLWSGYASFLPWARWTAAAAGLAALAVLVTGRLAERDRLRARLPGLPAPLVTAALAVAMAALLAAPAIWSVSVLDVKYAGTSFDASAGPAGISVGQGQGCGPGSQGSEPAAAFNCTHARRPPNADEQRPAVYPAGHSVING